ncbi:hypothetical protein C7448_102410 [Tenacibaculum gallaicum]|uniref:Uncharacterized protein n=1 Tax=Tenacibaculum gallaicum TaxID=561505 RepID=A0A3E0I838_9FLAO|nr:hypothetical protein [Tenacibaculum gallaicum]REH54882.1 hypothetical protein C7448_102410 [Tenacibaculum gallaicum]
MNDPLPILEPFADSLKKINVGPFLKSRDFKRLRIQAGLEEYWRNTYNHVKNSRRVISLEMDYEKYDSINTLNILMNDLIEKANNRFYLFIRDFLITFSTWLNEPFDTTEIIEDLELLNCPTTIIEDVKKLDSTNKTAVPKLEIPNIIDNSDKLEECLRKMDESIRNEEFNLTLTYAYSSLEGIFKTYIFLKVPSQKDETELSKISKIVREDLKARFLETDKKFPEPMLNLIGTITNAISNARNNFSESHFDKDSDKWLAEFTRDCVNSIGRLILKFVE